MCIRSCFSWQICDWRCCNSKYLFQTFITFHICTGLPSSLGHGTTITSLSYHAIAVALSSCNHEKMAFSPFCRHCHGFLHGSNGHTMLHSHDICSIRIRGIESSNRNSSRPLPRLQLAQNAISVMAADVAIINKTLRNWIHELKKPRCIGVFRRAIRGDPLEDFQGHSGVSSGRLVSDTAQAVDRGPYTILASSALHKNKMLCPRLATRIDHRLPYRLSSWNLARSSDLLRASYMSQSGCMLLSMLSIIALASPRPIPVDCLRFFVLLDFQSSRASLYLESSRTNAACFLMGSWSIRMPSSHMQE